MEQAMEAHPAAANAHPVRLSTSLTRGTTIC